MKAIFVVGGLYSRANGVAWIMRDLAGALGRAGSPIDVYGADCWGRGERSIGDIFDTPSRWHSAKGLWLGGLSWSPGTRRLIHHAVRSANVVHNHSLWMLPNAYSSFAARKHRKPIVITAHGALEPWAIENSGWKKKVVGRWFQYRDLHTATCIHVNSHNELEGVRKLGFRNPIAIIPNGINPEDFAALPDADDFRRLWPATQGKSIALFMARLHKKKGLELLIKAWANLHLQFPHWHLVVAGPDDGFKPTVDQMLHELKLETSVTLVGNLQGKEKLSALAAADCFMLPSFSEGFSMAILEAMACAIPVLITPGCNFPEAVEAGAALCVQPSEDAVQGGIAQLLQLSSGERRRMGELGKELVLKSYSWDQVAQRTLALYRWAIEKEAPPSFLHQAEYAS